MINLTKSVSLTTSYQKITIPVPPNPSSNVSNCNPVAVWTSDGAVFHVAGVEVPGAGESVEVPADKSFNFECLKADADGGIMWVKADTGTPTLNIAVGVALKKRA